MNSRADVDQIFGLGGLSINNRCIQSLLGQLLA